MRSMRESEKHHMVRPQRPQKALLLKRRSHEQLETHQSSTQRSMQSVQEAYQANSTRTFTQRSRSRNSSNSQGSSARKFQNDKNFAATPTNLLIKHEQHFSKDTFEPQTRIDAPAYASIYEKTERTHGTNSKLIANYNTPDVMSGVTTTRGNSDLKDLDGSEALMVEMEPRLLPTSPADKENASQNKYSNYDLPLKSPTVTQASLNRSIRNFERNRGVATNLQTDAMNHTRRQKSRNKKKTSSS